MPTTYSISDFPNSTIFTRQLKQLKDQLPAVLADFKRYYLLVNSTPDNSEYQQMYKNIEQNLIKINSDVFKISNDIQGYTDNLNNQLTSLNNDIGHEKTTNTELNSDVNDLKNNKNTSSEMISEYSEIYDYGYLQNWALCLSIFIAGIAISKVYSNKQVIVVK